MPKIERRTERTRTDGKEGKEEEDQKKKIVPVKNAKDPRLSVYCLSDVCALCVSLWREGKRTSEG